MRHRPGAGGLSGPGIVTIMSAPRAAPAPVFFVSGVLIDGRTQDHRPVGRRENQHS
jgi:hypothetical protein